MLLAALGTELVVLAAFLGIPAVAGLLGGSPPTALGWALAAVAVPAVLLADSAQKLVARSLRDREG